MRYAAETAAAGSDVVIASMVTAEGGWRCALRFQAQGDGSATALSPFEPGGSSPREMGLAIANRIVLAHDGTLAASGSAGTEQILTISLAPA